ncbi:MAG: alpha/beta hydrolase [Gammaproteobacteria bacterium]|nr:alpha/beta hydrolase [Gammaproteobacteria bacterium]
MNYISKIKTRIKKIAIAKRRGANATTLHVEIAKNEKAKKQDVVFLLPGGPGADHSSDVKRSSELADIATLVYMDPRGCGASEKSLNPTKDYTMDNYIKDVEEIRRQLGYKKIVILGTSYGGMVAIGYVLKYPQHVKKLILVSTAPSYRYLPYAKRKLKEIGTKEQITLAKKLWSGTFVNEHELNEFFVKFAPLYSLKAAKEKHNTSFKPGLVCREALNLGFKSFLREFDYESRLSKIKCPTLILAGTHDWIIVPHNAKIMAKKIKHSILQIYHSGHSVGIDVHDKYIADIKKFLSSKSKTI